MKARKHEVHIINFNLFLKPLARVEKEPKPLYVEFDRKREKGSSECRVY